MHKRQVLLESISALLVLLFLYASVSKFLDFQRFVGDMNNQPFPKPVVFLLIWGLPSLEIAIALSLIVERTRLVSLYASLILMGLFTIYTGAILLRFFAYIPCSCGGVIRKLTWKQHLFFNLFFVAISAVGAKLQRRKSLNTINITKNSLV
jgi:putative oxidoreductase